MATAPTRTATASPIERPPRNVRMIIFSLKFGKGNWPGRQWLPLQFGLLPHDDLGADGYAIVEIAHVGVDEAEAAGGDLGADRIRPVGAVDAVDGGAEIHRACAERIAGPAGHEARQVRLARDHLRRRRPVRPFLLVADV